MRQKSSTTETPSERLVRDIGEEALAVDGAIEHAWCVDTIDTQRRDKRHRLPMAVQHLSRKTLATRRPSAQWRHVRLRPRLVDEDEALGVDPFLISLPAVAPPGDVRTVLLGGKDAFF